MESPEPRKPKRIPSYIFWLEVIIWMVIVYFGRTYFDTLTGRLSPAWLVLVLKYAFFLALIGVAVFLHNRLERFLRSRGMID